MFKRVDENENGFTFSLKENRSRRHRPSLMGSFWVRAALSQRPSLLMKSRLHHTPQSPVCNKPQPFTSQDAGSPQIVFPFSYFHICFPCQIHLIRDTMCLRIEQKAILSAKLQNLTVNINKRKLQKWLHAIQRFIIPLQMYLLDNYNTCTTTSLIH